jgi:membrane protein DedA with SNARE-associated domain
MMSHLISSVGDLIKAWFNTLGYGGIVLAMSLESCLIPIPSEIIMPVAGAFIVGIAGSHTNFNLVGVSIAGAVGCVIGSAVAYWIGATGGRPFIMKYGKYILISRHDFDMADRWFMRFGSQITFISRLLPIIRTYISLPAGISRMNFGKFVAYTFLGSLPWCFVLAFLGTKLGENYEKVGSYLHGLDVVVGVVIVLAVVAYVWRHIRQERAYDAHQQNLEPTQKMPRASR